MQSDESFQLTSEVQPAIAPPDPLKLAILEALRPLTAKRRLFISFSGGKTSAFMTWLLLTVYGHLWSEVVILFANTGEEHEKTLEYVRNCAAHYGWKVIWVEAVIDPRENKGTTHRVVTFETAFRRKADQTTGPFAEMIQKYGIPNPDFFHCTRELKLNAMLSYLASIGWEEGTYVTAVGIRVDELDRISPNSMAAGVFYPLISLKKRKADVLEWESQQPVRLGIPEHLGNCRFCWKKSDRKLATVWIDEPDAAEFAMYHEVHSKDLGAGDGDRKWFRGERLVVDIIAIARTPGFQPFVDGYVFNDEKLDFGMSCGEGCDIHTDGPNEWPRNAA